MGALAALVQLNKRLQQLIAREEALLGLPKGPHLKPLSHRVVNVRPLEEAIAPVAAAKRVEK